MLPIEISDFAKAPSALERVNVRRLMLFIDKAIRQIVRDSGSVNSADCQSQMAIQISELMGSLHDRRAIASFRIDESQNRIAVSFSPKSGDSNIKIELNRGKPCNQSK